VVLSGFLLRCALGRLCECARRRRRVVARAARPQARGPIPKGYKIATGVLHGVSAHYFVSAAVADALDALTSEEQDTLRTAWLALETGCAVAGTIVLMRGYSAASLARSIMPLGFRVRGGFSWGASRATVRK
jgi:hypothetical protein